MIFHLWILKNSTLNRIIIIIWTCSSCIFRVTEEKTPRWTEDQWVDFWFLLFACRNVSWMLTLGLKPAALTWAELLLPGPWWWERQRRSSWSCRPSRRRCKWSDTLTWWSLTSTRRILQPVWQARLFFFFSKNLQKNNKRLGWILNPAGSFDSADESLNSPTRGCIESL